MWNSLTSGVGMFAAKQKMNSMFGGSNEQEVNTDKSAKMRQELAEKRKEREAAEAPKTEKKKLSAMWAENKAKNQS